MAMLKSLVVLFTLLVTSACAPDLVAPKVTRPKAPTHQAAAPASSEPSAKAEEVQKKECKEADGFTLVNGECVEKEVKPKEEPKPEQLVVGVQCAKNDLADCKLQCERGHINSCVDLGNMYSMDSSPKKDYALALQAFTKACDAGNQIGCVSVGCLYDLGHGVPQDHIKAAGFYKAGCEKGALGGCTLLGFMYQYGRGFAKDYVRAAALFKQACDGGEYDSCNFLARLYLGGKGVAKDLKKAATLFKKACDGGEKLGCEAAALMAKMEATKTWKTMGVSEFKLYATKIVDVRVLANPGLALSAMGLMTIAMNPRTSAAQKEAQVAEFYANTFFAEDVLIVDDHFKVSPRFIGWYKQAVPILARVRANCIQECLESDVRATRDACTARCSKY